MRLSRNRNWGHPGLIRFLEGLGTKVAKAGTWRGPLVCDMSQPRGGAHDHWPCQPSGRSRRRHLAHPMPRRELSRAEREEMSATMVVADDRHQSPV
jgi:penicillin-insensitive murein endopeptidase